MTDLIQHVDAPAGPGTYLGTALSWQMVGLIVAFAPAAGLGARALWVLMLRLEQNRRWTPARVTRMIYRQFAGAGFVAFLLAGAVAYAIAFTTPAAERAAGTVSVLWTLLLAAAAMDVLAAIGCGTVWVALSAHHHHGRRRLSRALRMVGGDRRVG